MTTVVDGPSHTVATPARARAAAVRLPLVLAAVGVVAFSVLSLELSLTRLFSFFLSYNTVFLVVSLVLGALGVGALLVAWTPAWSKAPRFASATLALAALLLVAGLWGILTISGANVLVSGGLLLLPLIALGAFMAWAYASLPGRAGVLYAADLAGAALGVLVTLVLLDRWDPVQIVVLLAVVLALTAGGVLLVQGAGGRADNGRAGWWAWGAVLLAVAVGVAGSRLSSARLTETLSRSSAVAPEKTLFSTLRPGSGQGRITETYWHSLGRVDVVQTDRTDAQYLFTDGGAGMEMYGFDGSLDSVAALAASPEMLPLATGAVERVLVIGPGGGKDLLTTRMAGSRQIEAVEINPAIVRAVEDAAAYNGDVYHLPEVHLVVEDGRRYLGRASSDFELVLLNLVYSQAAQPGGQSLAENRLFTTEAFKLMLDRLAPGGRVVFVAHSLPEATRIFATASVALQEAWGLTPIETRQRLMLFTAAHEAGGGQRTTLVELLRDPLEPERAQLLLDAAPNFGVQPIYIPGVLETDIVRSLLLLGVDLDLYDLTPPTDNRPFFYNFDRLAPAPVVYTLVGSTVLLAGLISLGLVKRRQIPAARLARGLAYFAVLGAGFIIVELALVQVTALITGRPVFALGLVLCGLLASGGLGSLAAARSPRLARFAAMAPMWVLGLVLLLMLGLPWAREVLTRSLPATQTGALLAIAVVLGFPMGMPFPRGLAKWSENLRQPVSWAWSVNSAAAVLGGGLAVVVAMTYGYSALFFVGCLCYAVAFFAGDRLVL